MSSASRPSRSTNLKPPLERQGCLSHSCFRFRLHFWEKILFVFHNQSTRRIQFLKISVYCLPWRVKKILGPWVAVFPKKVFFLLKTHVVNLACCQLNPLWQPILFPTAPNFTWIDLVIQRFEFSHFPPKKTTFWNSGTFFGAFSFLPRRDKNVFFFDVVFYCYSKTPIFKRNMVLDNLGGRQRCTPLKLSQNGQVPRMALFPLP